MISLCFEVEVFQQKPKKGISQLQHHEDAGLLEVVAERKKFRWHGVNHFVSENFKIAKPVRRLTSFESIIFVNGNELTEIVFQTGQRN